jgi:DNA-binding SARP family transcriptional activator
VTTIELLGRPAVHAQHGTVQSPRDRKTWALLTYLILAERTPSRQRLGELLFAQARDPLAGVRWNLAQLRRLLGANAVIEGDPVRLQLPADTTVDVDVLLRGRWSEAVALPLHLELLGGLTFDSAPAFELWLTVARRRVRSAAAAVLHEAALATLVNDPDSAVRLAERLVDVDPYDENHHVLLVRALATSGRTADAAKSAQDCAQFLQRELGVRPTGALRDALSAPPSVSALTWTPTRASVLAQLEAGVAATGAGSWTHGIDHLRQAVAGARSTSDEQLQARCLVRLGSALVHAARGYDEEGAASLHEGGALAETCGDDRLAATAWRELAWVEFLRARHDRARLWLDRAESASDDPTEAAWIALTSGACRTDLGDYAQADRDLGRAIDLADAAQLAAPAAFARSFQGRLYLLRNELDAAEQALRSSIDRATAIGWTSMIPWPESLLAEVHLRRGDVDTAAEMFEHAFTMGRQLGDPCWESMGARGLGLVAILRDDLDAGVRMLEKAPAICRRLPDSYLWIEAYGLEALCSVAVHRRLPSASRWIAELERLAAQGGFVELTALALYHRARLGEPGAAQAARAATDQIDSPALKQRISQLNVNPAYLGA